MLVSLYWGSWFFNIQDAAERRVGFNLLIFAIRAGVLGLTTTLRLLQAGYKNVTVIAKHMPADYDIEYTSPWAGANWVP